MRFYKNNLPKDKSFDFDDNTETSKTSRKKWVIIGVIIVLLASVAVAAWLVLSRNRATKPASTPTTNKPQVTTPASQPDRLRLIATGDTIAHDAINKAAKKPDGTYDYYQFMKNMQSFFDKSDVRFCNQAVPGGGEEHGISGYPVFNSPTAVADGLNKLGCNVINTGTNHTFDKGQPVIDSWLKHWDSLPNVLAVAGANRSKEEQNKLRYFTQKGVRFAFLSYTTYTNSPPTTSYGLNMFSEELAAKQLKEARSSADVVLVSMRWGTEYSSSINAKQQNIAQFLSDNGADVVFGHGPHVFQPVKQVSSKDGQRKTLVWYSLGNFMNAQLETEALVNGVAIMDIDVKSKKITDISLMPIYMHYEWTAEQKARQDLLSRHSFALYPLDKATDQLKKSQLNTTVEVQRDRLLKVLGQDSPAKLIDSSQY